MKEIKRSIHTYKTTLSRLSFFGS